MTPEFYSIDIFQRIMSLEESRGRLKDYCYSPEAKGLSLKIKELRHELRKRPKDQREELQQQLENLTQQYEEEKKAEITIAYNRVVHGKYHLKLREVEAKGKKAYAVDDMPSMLISKFIAMEIRNQYQLRPANRDEVVEELRVLLDNSMPKILIRADIHHFYESIDQHRLLERIEEDDYLTATSVRYLRKFFYEYNKLTNNQKHKGIPRGLSFSPALAEIYLREFDRKVKSINGLYFYKRYVDDIVLLVNPKKISIDDCWDTIQKIAESLCLTLHDDDDKIVKIQMPMDDEEPLSFNYLGYQFKYDDGHSELLLTEEKVKRYCNTIDCVLRAYAKVANHRTKDENGKKHTDGLMQFMHRIDALTGNGNLDSRRNFVKTGLFYSNRLLTDLSQLEMLDRYLADALNDPKRFSPPQNLFNYGEGNNHDDNVNRIRKKILAKYSFRTGFHDRRMYRWNDYVIVLKQLQNLYYKSLL